MKAYLFTWNPSKVRDEKWSNLANDRTSNRNGGIVRLPVSTAGSRKPQPGDLAFLLVQGEEPKGIRASGRVATEVYEDDGWDGSSKKETYVEVDFDVFLHRSELLRRCELVDDPGLHVIHWDTQRSGNEIKAKPGSRFSGDILALFKQKWLEHLRRINWPTIPKSF